MKKRREPKRDSVALLYDRGWKNGLFNAVNYLLLGLFAFACLYPFIFVIASSFNEGTDSLRGGVFLWPRKPTLDNYRAILKNTNFWSAYRVTILRTVVGTLGSLFVTSIVAYGLTDKKMPGRSVILIFMLIPMLFGGGLIPGYVNLRNLGLLNTFWVYIIPGLFSIWNSIIFRTSFGSIPDSLKESMRLDGAGEFTIYCRVMVPLSKATFAALGLFTAVGHWNDWFSGAYYVNKQELVPLQTLLHNLLNKDLAAITGRDMTNKIQQLAEATNVGIDWTSITSMSMKMATVLVGTLPILLVYPFVQRYFMAGVMIGSIKQ